jgi:hypothetical protein
MDGIGIDAIDLGTPVHPDETRVERRSLPIDGDATIELAGEAQRLDIVRLASGRLQGAVNSRA